jgi:hypothetical protein
VASSTCFVTTETPSNGGNDFEVLHQIYDACPGDLGEGENCYAWDVATTSAALKSAPSGLELISVDYVEDCASTGCWEIKAQLTTGYSDVVKPGVIRGFNSLYVPRAELPAGFSYSYDYSYPDEVHTFDPNNFPCKTSDGSSSTVVDEDTACCLTFTDGVLAEYRVTGAFASAVTAETTDGCNRDVGNLVDNDMTLWAEGEKFEGMTNSPGVVTVTEKDAYVGRYEITVQLDEVELRSLAGMLTGTVGVEYTVDTFLGWSHFKAVGTQDAPSSILESLATQQAIHLEKTNFFTVSTHGTNDYTFLEYVNLRLVAIYDEDTDFSDESDGEVTTDMIRTDDTKQAQYVQVTFTMGDKYNVKANEALIPSDSVRVGKGTFADSTAMTHACDAWTALADGGSEFETWLGQTCAPAATMCNSPSDVPDSFVAFNIPLGIGSPDDLVTELGDYLGAGADDLSENIFVHMVIAAEDTTCTDPSEGSCIMKTTLSASIPIVTGGINIFCDGLTAKTDLRDVADVDIVVGTANGLAELSRLMIKTDVTDSALNPETARTQIDSDSIEAGVMTLVIKGQDEYFSNNPGRSEVSVELEDVITIHIMGTSDDDCEDPPCTIADIVENLITADQDDNTDASGLDTDGYALNGAFNMVIDRSALRAHLEPSADLLNICPFNPVRPNGGTFVGETCVTRRDVRYRGYPFRNGAYSTALEICAGSVSPSCAEGDAKAFFTSFLGNSDYAKDLAVAHTQAISQKYDLNGRYKRAYMINPGYEWTPTQTGGTPIFSVSQKLFMFALITLDEGIADDDGMDAPETSYPAIRRRMLLSSVEDALKDGQSGLGSTTIEFQTSPAQMLASAYDVPSDKVATYKVIMKLTDQEVCMADVALAESVRATLADMAKDVASAHQTVQILTMKVDKAGIECRRSLRGLKETFTDATVEVTMAVVFVSGKTAEFSPAKLMGKSGVVNVTPLDVSPKVVEKSADFVPEPTEKESYVNVGLIVGIVVGVVAAIAVLAIGAFFFMKRSEPQPVTAVQTINVEDLKSQLAGEV